MPSCKLYKRLMHRCTGFIYYGDHISTPVVNVKVILSFL